MQIWIHDSKMRKITALNNDIPDMLSYSNSAWHPYLDQATSTFDFTIPKFVNGKLHEDIKLINDECFVSFYVNDSYQVFYIATLQEDDFNIQLTCNNTNLEYALEYANPFSSSEAQPIEWYLQHMDLLSFAAAEIGINEISDRKRTLTFDSQETKMNRLQSLMSNFDAEFEFKTELNRDGTYKRIAINIYRRDGIGTDRKDVVLYYSNGLKGVQATSDKTQMFNAGVFTGKDGLSLADVEISEKNADGIEEFYSRKGNPCLYAPLAMNRYPATMKSDGQDNWIRKDFQTEYENVNDLKAYALRTLKQYAYPLMTYMASVQSGFVNQYTDLKLGDTIRIIDKNFAGGLALEARVSEMVISFDNPTNNSFVFTNYRKIDNKPSAALQTRIDQAVENKLPYHIELATTGGVTFKNNEGETIVKPSLYKGNLPYTTDVTWRWSLDGVVTVGMQYRIQAKNITDTAVLTAAGYVGNTEVATTEITLTNVNDGAQGPQGPKGDKGDDGRAETRKETFYKLTNSADVPTVPNEGGRNLLTGTRDWSSNIQTWANNNGVWNDETDDYNNLKVKSTTGGWNGWHQNVFVKAGEYYTLSYYAKSDTNITVNNSLTWEQSPIFKPPVATFDGSNNISDSITTDWERYSRTIKITGDGSLQWRIEYNDSTLPSGKWYIAGMKLEERSSASNYSVAPEDLGWSIDMLVPTQQQRYLWKFEYIYYSDGLVKVTQPVNLSIAGQNGIQGPQGIPGPQGDQGADGKTQYTHIAYADDATGGEFSQTSAGKTYIGMYQDFNPTDSNDPTAYNWSKWKGDEGAPGKPGADGKTSYFHMAYAESADGKTGFSFTESGQQYQGYYTDFTQANSTDPTKYTWMDRRAGVEPGFRNLLTQTNKGKTNWGWNTSDGGTTVEDYNVDGINAVKLTRTIDSPASWSYIQYKGLLRNLIEPSTKYTLSFDVFPSQDVTFNALLIRGDYTTPLTNSAAMNKATGNQWTKVSCILTSVSAFPDDLGQVVYLEGMPTAKDNYLIIKNIKLERGNIPTPWIPALEDTQEQIDSKADQALTQDQLNALAEKNRNMEAEMAAKASLAEIEQWKQAFDSYVAQDNADKTEAEQKLITLTSRVAEWVKDWEDKKVQWSFLDTNMDFGEEGLRLGKKGSPTSILISNDRIGFYSGGSEVASMSNGTLTIDNGIFAKSLQIGHYREEVYEGDKTINVIRWVD